MRRLQTLFGTVEVEAPRFKLCRCRPSAPMADVTVSPVCALLTARCAPGLERVQAELGARTSVRDGARILQAVLPVSAANHESLRTRTHAVALRIGAADRQAATEVMAVRNEPDKAAVADEHRPIVMLDAAYIRAAPGHRVRNFEAICGTVEHEAHATRRFALVRPATDGPTRYRLDWFHLSMRVHHVEQAVGGLCAVEPPRLAPLGYAQADVERLRHLLWNGYHETACEALGRIMSWAETAIMPNEPAAKAKVGRLVARCAE